MALMVEERPRVETGSANHGNDGGRELQLPGYVTGACPLTSAESGLAINSAPMGASSRPATHQDRG